MIISRVAYNKVILSKAKWIVTADEISFLHNKLKMCFEVLPIGERERQLPQW
jgi:hypothetical protein